jgi:hypothetical protein
MSDMQPRIVACAECGGNSQYLVHADTVSPLTCSKCAARARLTFVGAASLARLDAHIVAQEIVQGIVLLRSTTAAVSLPEALELFGVRYEELRAARDADFACSAEEYWNGFYS